MIIYDREKKELIVPATFAGGGDNCGQEIEQAYQEGWDEGFASGASSCSGLSIQPQKYIYVNERPSAGEVFIRPDEGYDGIAEGIANIDNVLDVYWSAGYEQGKPEGILEGEERVRSQFTTLNVSNNGTYTASGDAAFSAVSVNVNAGFGIGFSATFETSGNAYLNSSVAFFGDMQGNKYAGHMTDYYAIDDVWNYTGPLADGTHTYKIALSEWRGQENYFTPWNFTEADLIFANYDAIRFDATHIIVFN